MSSRDYRGTADRTFGAALLHLLETDYGILGSRRVLSLLVNDLQALVDQFYPTLTHVPSGWLVFTGTKATGPKAHPGQKAAEYELVTLAWPVLLADDVQRLANLPPGRAGVQARVALLRDRVVRLIEYGWQHPAGPVVLSEADLAAMLNLPPGRIVELLADARQVTGKELLTKGYVFDQGMRPTHKTETIALYEAGCDELTIARRIGHAQTSVGQYIRDYERVKLLLAHHTPVEHIPQLTGLAPSVVQAHVRLVYQYHPDLVSEGLSPSAT
jgi:hypothetical protein